MFFEVIPTEVYRDGGGALTYSFDQKLLPGHIVLIPLGRRTITGIVLRKVPQVNFPTKSIIKLAHPIPLPSHLLKSILWLSKYYLSPLPACANLMLPAGLTSRTALKTIEKTSPATGEFTSRKPHINLNQHQRQALRALSAAPGTTRLLRGVTGSGKTNIYLQIASETLQKGKSVILLVPEIALTSQLVKIFSETFGDRVVLIHSNQTMVERRNTWLNLLIKTSANSEVVFLPETIHSVTDNARIKGEAIGDEMPGESKARKGVGLQALLLRTGAFNAAVRSESEPLVVIGPRSALLAPLANLGLIIIDEAHESTYYQDNSPRYSALRLASFIAGTLKIPCIEGTATPNIVDFYLAKTHNSLIELTEKAKTTAIDPKITLVDLKDRANFQKNRYLSNQLLTSIENNLQNKHQSLIFHNRRGSSPLTICEKCGWQALCPNCYLPMILHTDGYLLSCHICGHEAKVPSTCPECGHPDIIHKGFGTKLLEAELKNLFPKATIARFDGDNKKDQDLTSLYSEVKSGKIDILIGTQTLARGLDLPHLATVGVVQADSGLSLPDFSAEERTFELLTQVIGRVGRGHLDKAEVIIQTFQPDHPVIRTAITANYPEFADYLLKKRRSQKLPPYTYLARLDITYKTEKTTLKKITAAAAAFAKVPGLTVSPPMPAFHERTARGYTWQIILKSTSRETLLRALAPFQNFHIELDPPSLL